jgi:hypothetical protein
MLSDTAPDVERMMADIDRRMPPWRKMQRVNDAWITARELHAAGYRLRHPDATDVDVNREWAIMTLGPGPWIERMEFERMTPRDENIRSIKFVIQVLDDLNIRYAIGGSWASSLHGRPRHTDDADIAVEPFHGKERLFAARFPQEDWYIDLGMIQDALSHRASFNILDLRTSFKIDIFIQKDRDFDREFLSRRIKAKVLGPNDEEFGVVAAEDSVLLKLEWYRLGNETSDRQWNDVLAVIRTQREALDRKYLVKWAAEIGVTHLLDRAWSQV